MISVLILNKSNNINYLLKSRTGLVEILAKHNLYQAPAMDLEINELRKNGKRYFIYNRVLNKMATPKGVYIFVIRSWEPGKVYCAHMGTIDGHTSMVRNSGSEIGSVLFAGELLFDDGILLSWNNGSGHYRPDASLIQTNLLPHIKLMLPEPLFRQTDTGRTFGYQNTV